MLQCTEGVRSGCSCRLTVKCVPQVSMRTPRGVGMPRAKKKKAAVQEEAGPSCAEPDPAVLMPPPPPRPPKPAATQAPAKDPDFEARQFAGRVLQLAIKQHKAREREFARSEKRVAAAVEKNDDMGAKKQDRPPAAQEASRCGEGAQTAPQGRAVHQQGADAACPGYAQDICMLHLPPRARCSSAN